MALLAALASAGPGAADEAPATRECLLRIADLSDLHAARTADIAGWQSRLRQLDARVATLRADVLAVHLSLGGGCPPALLEGIDTLRADVAAAARGSDDIPLPRWLADSRPEVFHCLSDLGVRLSAAQATALAESNMLQVSRLTQISATLTGLDRDLTRMMIEAQAAAIKHDRLHEELDAFVETCTGPDF